MVSKVHRRSCPHRMVGSWRVVGSLWLTWVLLDLVTTTNLSFFVSLSWCIPFSFTVGGTYKSVLMLSCKLPRKVRVLFMFQCLPSRCKTSNERTWVHLFLGVCHFSFLLFSGLLGVIQWGEGLWPREWHKVTNVHLIFRTYSLVDTPVD